MPLFLFQAVQAGAAARSWPAWRRRACHDDFVRGFRKLMTLVLIVGVRRPSSAAFLLGPFIVKVFFDSDLSRRTLTHAGPVERALHGGSGPGPGHHRPRGHAKVAIGWVIGMVVFLAVAAIPNDDLLLRVELALVAGSLAALIVFGLVLRAVLPRRDRARRGLDLSRPSTRFPWSCDGAIEL